MVKIRKPRRGLASPRALSLKVSSPWESALRAGNARLCQPVATDQLYFLDLSKANYLKKQVQAEVK